ncbi:hypothetical protein [Roseinatronobacter sp. S2]|uniref:hypothetical protein n=1 Tax=Roseinatronobacter sp. S2 TaxID=3035471 RepID=UPI00240FCAD1|nr:hypothetical protein [Roseinatronobacter sp. S2]WFE74244.1 hypothetical protein P8S53_13790 [Roseinatronobacter sp. S2]
MTTTYTIHRAYDHGVAATASGVTLQSRAQALAEDAENHGRRFYVHNGSGVCAAFLVKPQGAFDLLHADYRQFDQAARERREAINL